MVDVSMWWRALRVIPRISRGEWDRLDIISRWLIASRAAVFVMTLVSALIGGMLAWRDGFANPALLAICAAGLVFAHAANNLVNDLTDHRRGVDRGNYYRSLYGPHPLEHGLLSQRRFVGYVLVTLSIALAAGVWLALVTAPGTWVLFAAGVIFLLFYTWPLKYIGMGEVAVMLVWGPLMIGGTYYVVSGGVWSWDVALVSVAYAIGPTNVLVGKHTDKIPDDRERGIRTLPVLMGERAARRTAIVLWMAQYALIALLVARGALGPAILVTLLALPRLVGAVRVFARPRPSEEPQGLEPNVWPLYLSHRAFRYSRVFGMLFLLGLVGDLLLDRLGWL